MNRTASIVIEDPDPVNQGVQVQINIIYAILIPIIIITGSVFNLTTIFAFWKMPDLRDKPSDLLILNLSVIDLITSMVFLPIGSPVYITPGYWPFGEIGCRVISSIMNTTIHGSLLALIAISLDRFLLVYLEYPKYVQMQSRKRVCVTIALGWAVALASVITEQGLWNHAKELDETAASIPFDKYCLVPPRRIKWFSLSFFAALFFMPVMIVCGLSIAFLWQLRKRLKKSRGSGSKTISRVVSKTQIEVTSIENESVLSLSKTESQSSKSQLSAPGKDRTRNLYTKPAVTLIGLVLTMAVCMLPYCSYVVITELGCQLCNNTDLLYALLLLQFSNAAIDPFIYVLTRRKIRQFYSKCYCRCRFQVNF